jgi:glycosyltransferase involved in cell wall biosynthesis
MPQSFTTRAYSACGFSQKTIRFCWMMKSLGHTVFLYSGPDNEAVCDEHVVISTEDDQKLITGGSHYIYPSWQTGHPIWVKTNQTAVDEIGKRKQPGDFVCVLGGNCQKQIADSLSDLKVVEYGIGYEGFFSKWKVWESHVWRSYCIGRWANSRPIDQHDTVINAFYDDMEYVRNVPKKPYALFLGRVTPAKGIEEACEAAQIAGMPLKVAGFGNPKLVTRNAEYLGVVDLDQKLALLGEASVLICPTRTFEPFGNVACEAQLSGTPVVSTNYGGFVESVEDGVTGYRCNTVGDMATALQRAPSLNRAIIVSRAIKLFSMRSKMFDYNRHFNALSAVQ